MLSHAFWKREFEGDRMIVGQGDHAEWWAVDCGWGVAGDLRFWRGVFSGDEGGLCLCRR